ncbi:endonuclease V [Flavobacterium silvaticum]|uniref:Endonuclease V n=1 Tax=Flavobacterium silvaticum TaxID=1852020 RepID=A0A972JFG2_9FLAO|nr:endonuclease V [Flavobacterium silvaticum]NMH27929.1 endonuclease V [Flavobacterium silvaticum]
MIAAVDTYYYGNKARTVAIVFRHWESGDFEGHYIEETEISAEYVPGEFYKRELPCILSILKKVDMDAIEAIVVDGYVFLDDDSKLGLGGHLYESLHRKYPVTGVAKTNFVSVKDKKKELFRGESKNPLYITAIGIDLENATQNISHMSGEYRNPKLLKQLDMLTKQIG